MAKTHWESCPGCLQRTLAVHQTESKDVLYCVECAYEGERVLARPRHVEPATVSVRDRGGPPQLRTVKNR